ncbi:EndoU domain-containing protein [Lentzea aerocolonigenes]|uniref:EndoU domain-containing protein n=1 Tax=Lentzea aerocolonigenes TaxID=68170 RepID=UPI0009DE1ED0|nr:EndoU domain-containing protein [Lentzea aerocolonigenes]
MSDDLEPYDPKMIYGHEASGRGAIRGKYGDWEDGVVENEDLDITAETRHAASYISPYRMDHIAELHSSRAVVRGNTKSLFPAEWTDDKIFEAVQAVIGDAASRWTRGDDDWSGEPGSMFNPWHPMDDIEFEIPARFRVDGYFEDVKLRVVVEPLGEGVITAYTLQY